MSGGIASSDELSGKMSPKRIFPTGRKSWAAFFAFFLYALWTHFNFSSFSVINMGDALSSALSYNTSVQINGVALIVLALLYKRYEKHVFDSGAAVASIFLCAAGTLLAATTGIFVIQNPLIDFTAGAMSGIGSALLLMMLAMLVVRTEGYIPHVLFAFLFARAVAVPMSLLPTIVLLPLVIALPALAIVCVFTARDDKTAAAAEPIEKSDIRPMVPLMVRAVVFVLVVYLMIAVSNIFAQANGALPDSISLLVTTAIVAVLLMASCYSEGRKLNVMSVYRTVFFFSLVGVFSIPFFEGQFAIAYGIITVLTTLIRAFIMIVEYRICVKTGLSPLIVFGIGETIKKLPNLITTALLPFLPIGILLADPSTYIKVFIILALVLVGVYLFVFTEKNLLQLSKNDYTMGAEEQIEESRMRVAHRFGLTERETEIFMHLCEGRSTPWVAKELYISQATVNVHVKSIYKKCDVHSRQDLLDLVAK